MDPTPDPYQTPPLDKEETIMVLERIIDAIRNDRLVPLRWDHLIAFPSSGTCPAVGRSGHRQWRFNLVTEDAERTAGEKLAAIFR